MEIVEGIVARECESALKFIGDRLSRFLEVERLDRRDLDGLFPILFGGELC